MADTLELQPSRIEFWIEKAREIKKVADLCWDLDETVEHRLGEAKLQGMAKSLVKSSLGVDADLKWLYGNLMAFAIQYLCIGILVQRNPKRFLNEVPGYRIIELAEECGVTLNNLQRHFLRQVEASFKWGQRKSEWNIELSKDQLLSLRDKRESDHMIKPEEKTGLEDLFVSLNRLALQKLAERETGVMP